MKLLLFLLFIHTVSSIFIPLYINKEKLNKISGFSISFLYNKNSKNLSLRKPHFSLFNNSSYNNSDLSDISDLSRYYSFLLIS
tara:strand:- start:4760 stop:5008 length:249 start_codon:yes stop_codon:yes gene_type:complete